MLKPVYQSATQVTNFKACNRSWGFQKISMLSTPQRHSLELGKRVHDILEFFLQGKAKIDYEETWNFKPGAPTFYPGKIAAGMLGEALPSEYLDLMQAEMDFENDSISRDYGVVWRGKIDVHWVLRRYLTIVDHKTSKSPKQWGKTDEDLKSDVQGILYPRIGFDLYPDADVCKFSLNYGSTSAKYRENYVAKTLWNRADNLERFETLVVPFSKEMAQAYREQINPMELSPNPRHCDAFGGCPFRNNPCITTMQQRMGVFMKSGGLLGKLMDAKEKNTEAGLNPPEDGEEETAADETTAEAKKDKLKSLLGKKDEKPKTETKPKPAAKGGMLDKLKGAKTTTKTEAGEIKAEAAPAARKTSGPKAQNLPSKQQGDVKQAVIIAELSGLILGQPLPEEVRALAVGLIEDLKSAQ